MILVEKINSILWGAPTICLILFSGVYLSIRLRFFQIRHISLIAKKTFVSLFRRNLSAKERGTKQISQLQAVSTTLAATIGTGSIVGVASAISVGGAGAVFWMWVSAFFGMMTSYAENVLGALYRKKNKSGEWCGGAMYYINEGFKDKKILKHLSRILSGLFAFFCVAASFGIGNMVQSNSISEVIFIETGLPKLVTGTVLSVLCGSVILGGAKKTADFAQKVVPFMAIFYILASSAVIFLNIHLLPNAVWKIFSQAFSFKAIGGGTIGTGIGKSISQGFKRGIFSNEAGLGSGVLANSSSNIKQPCELGMWGIFEVFVNTMVVCTLTALTIITSGVNYIGIGEQGASLVSRSFAVIFHSSAGMIVSICIILFAFSSILGWSFYGEKAVNYLFGTRGVFLYKCIFVFVIFF